MRLLWRSDWERASLLGVYIRAVNHVDGPLGFLRRVNDARVERLDDNLPHGDTVFT